jgi:uncharacterized membrane protein YeaQ/YmgE (transglycosylase-associated protein family)
MSLVVFLIIGFLVGVVARAILPENQRMGFGATTALGVMGSVVGGLVGSVFYSRESWLEVQATPIIYSILGAVLVLIAMSVSGRWTHTGA